MQPTRQTRRPGPAWIAVVALAATACGAGPAPPEPATPPPPPNVIFVLIDTLRADHMSVYGFERPTTPYLERFSTESVVFDRARSQAACTFPSVNSILTSRWPHRFYSSNDEFMGIPSEVRSLPELFRAAGYRTAAVSASPIVRATPSKHNPNAGFEAGFEVFDETCLWREAACVNQRAREILDGLTEPYFLYLHYMDPHGHYAPPADYEQQFTRPYDGYDFIAAGDHNPIAEMLYDNGPKIDIKERDIEHLFDLYDDEIGYTDQQIESLFEDLRSTGVLDRSLVVVTSDHGEEFLEHGHVGHCRGIWNTLTWVPLILRGPGLPSGVRIEAPVQLVDLAPTLLDLTGVAVGDLQPVGTSLMPLVTGGDASAFRYAFSDQGKYRGADDGRFHLILDGVDRTFTLFDMVDDPGELQDLYATDHPDGARLSAELGDWLQRSGQWLRLEQALEAAAEKEEMLRALGYLE